jgi:flagellar basal-body rod protein FlgG
LVTSQGLRVMGENGPIQLDPRNTSPITIAANGRISHGDSVVGRVKVVDFTDPKALVSAGPGCFVVRDPSVEPTDPSPDVEVHQGYIEHSNISTVEEMGQLITAMRFYEANQKVAQMADDRVNRVISDAANPT